ncbi:MAG TPA: SCP2 sterol-binding domain-containing protein [Polyangiaceae bacterium LLY-WYZ-15_(1-7)]|nr:Fis family transcriptional regulator [Myxococcales bacterium]MAT25137.1 Fis family transcriptional regulator [Sandaracinus sp.]HJL01894.1 SCP2 sterol-binding domain-containing protein [Polyangiaceae bacterium LLY-WYZ-15_(1-7)]HJL11571.1 SCP2 sterol-binding domain-containing protein [Polyangiaceae bacterium LLY-WYZ-15_(1-7)]HJL28962.1 SCP2 sterol-binding domain-containing protein [Polyangiaceae bacterium LLY-WYZ-15_(1-7)]
MAHEFPSQEWTDAFKDAVNANEDYRTHGKPWTFGAVAMVCEKDPSLGLDDDMAMYFDVHEGECRGATLSKGRASVEHAPFVIVAPYARWKEVINGEVDPIKAMMEGKLKMTKGHLPTMLRFVESSRALVVSATKVPTSFKDE